MISKPYLFSAGGPINDGLKLLIDDGATDLGPDGLTITPTNTPGVGVNGFHGNGTDTYSVVGAVSDLTFVKNTRVFTLMAWVRKGTGGGCVLGNELVANDGLFWTASAARPVFRLRSVAALEVQIYSSTATPLNVWSQICVACNNSSATFAWYVNGASCKDAADQTYLTNTCTGDYSRLLWLGRNNHTNTFGTFDGHIRGVRAWNRALSASEVRYLYETERPAFYR